MWPAGVIRVCRLLVEGDKESVRGLASEQARSLLITGEFSLENESAVLRTRSSKRGYENKFYVRPTSKVGSNDFKS